MLGCAALEGGPRTFPGSTSLVASSPTVNFGTVVVGNSTAFTEFISNPTTSMVTVTGATVSGGDFQVTAPTFPVTILPGRRIGLTLSFAPQSAGNLSGTIMISSTAPQSPMTVLVSGRAISSGELVVNPTSISFGSVQLGKNQTSTATLTNAGATNVTVSQVAASTADFNVSGLALPMTLQPNQTVSFNVVFAPTASGARTGSVSISGTASTTTAAFRFRRFGPASRAASSGNQTATVSVAGVGTPASGSGNTVGQLTASPASLSFGSSQVGSSQSKPLVVTNSGNASVTISQAEATGAGYTLAGPNPPVTLSAGQAASFTVTFAPQSTTAGAGNVAIVSNASNSTLNVALSATVGSAGVLTTTPNSLGFGTVLVGNSQQLSATITNSGGSSVTVNQATVTGTGFSASAMSAPMTLAPNQSSNITITCSPKSAGPLSGSLAISSTASNASLAVPLTGTAVMPGALTVSPSSFSFGSVQTGSTQSVPATLTNTGGSSVTITQVTAGTGYSISGLSLPLTLQAGKSQAFSVVFAPNSAGAAGSSLTITSNASNPTLTAALTGTGVMAGALTVSPSSFSFGSVQTGSTQSVPATLTNTGGSSVTVTQVTAGTGYSISGLSLPLTLQAGKSQAFSVVFAPNSAGAAGSSLTITSNASNPTLTAALSGTGVTAGALTASAPSLSFGSVQVGKSQSLPETLTNSGGSSITLTQVAAGGGYSVSGLTLPLTLAAGSSTSFNVVFAPQSAGNSSISLAITSNASPPTLTVPLSGTGVTAGTITASSVSFGSVQVGSSSSKTATLTNSGGSSVTVSQANLTGSAFGMSGLSTPMTLTAGQSFTFGVTFTPQAAGAASGSIAIVSDASGSSPSVSLSGTGVAVGQFAVSPSSLSFGSVVVGANKSLTNTLSATGSSVTVSSASVSSAEFTMTGPSVPLTIPAGGTATFTVTFTPQSSGAASANATFVTNAAGSPTVEALSGTGTPAPQHSVSLSWSASTSTVAGYNVYRGGQTGGPYAKINSATDTVTNYTDNSVQAGQTYFYVTTAVASDGTESGFSNEVRAAIPTP
jgi:Abnormal spindle-like microcephaly-assoc'd, ASPM-SPD-2-Hydin/Cep192 domain 4/HYDIN/CFA65/VesB-like, Ig-like domain